MRAAFAVLALALAITPVQGAGAQPEKQNSADSASTAPPDPKQWTMPPEGAVHEASGTKCLAEVGGFARMQFSAASEANVLGSCLYVDDTGSGDAGVRVRIYMSGVGESREVIANDHALMEPDSGQGAPLFTVRMAPATTRDGVKGGRVTITKVRNGYLIDCFAEGATLVAASAKMALICGN